MVLLERLGYLYHAALQNNKFKFKKGGSSFNVIIIAVVPIYLLSFRPVYFSVSMV